MTANSVSNEVEKSTDILICESCGREFSCGAKTGNCWCFDLEISPESLTELQSEFQNCLCGNCLRKLQSNEEIL